MDNCPCMPHCSGNSDKLLCQILITKLFSAGCPCPEFNCNLLDPLAESCKDLSTNQNWVKCEEMAEHEFDRCMHQCENEACKDACMKNLDLALDNCPCGTNCKCINYGFTLKF